MNNEFEKLPIIQEIITDEYDGLMFDERFSKYLCPSDGNEEYLNGAWMVWQHQQSKIVDLQAMFVEQARTASNQQAKIDELQKRVDALSNLIQDHLRELNECYESDKENKFEYWRGFSHSAGTSAKRLEQALKGGE